MTLCRILGFIKIAQINIFITKIQMTMCDVKGAACRNQPELTANSVVPHQSIIVSFAEFFWYYSPQLHCFFSLSKLSWASRFQQQQAAVFIKKRLRCFMPSIKRQRGRVSNWLVNIAEHLAAKEPHFFPQELVETKWELKGKLILKLYLSSANLALYLLNT